jgi:glycerol-3-phosphate dehydrogenase
VNAAITTHLTTADVTGTWAGLRPLVRSAHTHRTADLSRRHQVTVSPSGVVAISGGKLTTYREMAEDTVDAVVDQLRDSPDHARRARWAARWRRRVRRSGTRSLPLLGARGFVEPESGTRDAHLGNRYGTARHTLDALAAADPTLREPLVAGLPYERVEAVYAARHEMATTLLDVLIRRTQCHLIDRAATLAAAPTVAALLADELCWDDAETARQVGSYIALVDRERAAAEPSIEPVEAAPVDLVSGGPNGPFA